MTAYADTISRPVKTLTEAEQRALLKVTGQHVDGFRDHVIYSVALGAGLLDLAEQGAHVEFGARRGAVDAGRQRGTERRWLHAGRYPAHVLGGGPVLPWLCIPCEVKQV